MHPGEYIFDIMLVRGHSVGQLCLCKTNIVGTPTNKLVDHEEGESIYYTEPITINPDDKKPPEVHLDTPLVTDPPENLVETLRAVPPYLLQWLDLPDDPHRNALLKVFGPRASLMMTLRVPHDAVEHRYGFEQFFYGKLPIDCPLRGQAIVIKNREVFINTTKPMIMVASDQFIQHSPEITFGANCWDQMNSKPIYIGDNVTSGNLHIQLMEGNDQINIQGTYMMPDDMGGDIVFMLRVDWFNWVDNTPEPFEIEPHPGYHDDDRRKYYGTIGKYEESIWPFNVHYETEGELRGLLGDILRKAKERA